MPNTIPLSPDAKANIAAIIDGPTRFARFFLAVSLIIHLYFVAQGWYLPLVDMHDFRQTQTAWGARSIALGAEWFNYEVPVLGPPWRIPFELPLYQWLVATASTSFGISLESSGRSVSLVSLWMTLLTATVVLRSWKVPIVPQLYFCGLFLVNPCLSYWGRTMMIETLAVALGMSMCAAVELSKNNRWWIVLAILLGGLAGGVKITTAVIYILLCVAGLVRDLLSQNFDRSQRRALIFGSAVVVGSALASGVLWTHYTDSVKHVNPISAKLVSAELNTWNFGDLKQRLRFEVWSRIAVFTFFLSTGVVLPVLSALGSVFSRQRWGLAVSLFVATMAGPLLFTNLYFVHNYYSVANAPLLIMFCSCGLAGWNDRGFWKLSAVTATCGLGAAVWIWTSEYRPYQSAFSLLLGREQLLVAETIHNVIPKDEVVLILGHDWSPSLSYRSNRRAIMVPGFAPELACTTILDSLPPLRLGGIILPKDIQMLGDDKEGRRIYEQIVLLAREHHLSDTSFDIGYQYQAFVSPDTGKGLLAVLDGIKEASAGRFDKAVQLFDQADVLLPVSTLVSARRAPILASLGKCEQALIDCKRVEERGATMAGYLPACAQTRIECQSKLTDRALRTENLERLRLAIWQLRRWHADSEEVRQLETMLEKLQSQHRP